jgi:hypothetical protein
MPTPSDVLFNKYRDYAQVNAQQLARAAQRLGRPTLVRPSRTYHSSHSAGPEVHPGSTPGI